MSRYVITRVATSVLLLVATSVIVFAVLRALPGDPVITRLGSTQGVSQETIDRLREQLGLDRSVLAQYGEWVGGLLRGDFGTSYFSQYSVTDLIGQRIGTTLELTIVSVGLSVALAVPTAVVAALRPHGWIDRAISGLSSLGMAFPPFVASIFLLIVFSVQLGWLPARGWVPLDESVSENLRHLVLPAAALAAVASPLIVRYLRAELVEALDQPYVRTAEGKGVPRVSVVLRHALRNALLPALTSVGLIFGYTLGGAVLVEYVFGLPGLGSLAVESALRRDYAVLQTVVLLLCAGFILTTLVVDLLARALDPRLRTVNADG
ncbi:ABC transporter permease [Conexibacter stalactiti]|uniref:ABC transporter permease n=1 Tax=Conexibacter stalactiti TaxID=1940611 RepID=A0ABU4HYN4_9ACTN|nr:ABC transporter permease [Conexibacter stalactiti]MDW5598437.1 ABC transporter permease [Conexibacter stalactiti]MEC5039079.1 ABC transporter permease [Conexibacter stalactiti]